MLSSALQLLHPSSRHPCASLLALLCLVLVHSNVTVLAFADGEDLDASLRGASLVLRLDAYHLPFELGESVTLWPDLSKQKHDAHANFSGSANADQRRLNAAVDPTRITDKEWKLPLAMERVQQGKHDSAPLLVTCPELQTPAVMFDGDDCLQIAVHSDKDPLVPKNGSLTVFALLSLAERDMKNDHGFMEAWLSFGNPGFLSASQYSVLTTRRGSDESDAMALIRVVPEAHDPRRASVRESAALDTPLPANKPSLLSFTLDGSTVHAYVNSKEGKFESRERTMKKSGSPKYRGPINPFVDADDEEDDSGAPSLRHFRLGMGPACNSMYTGQGAIGRLYSIMVYNEKLSEARRKQVERYLGCRFKIDALCQMEAQGARDMEL